MSIGQTPGDCLAAAQIDTGTGTLLARSFGVASITVNVPLQDWTVTLTNQAQTGQDNAWCGSQLYQPSGAPVLFAVVELVAPGAWRVQCVDSTGALTNATGPIALIWLRAATQG